MKKFFFPLLMFFLLLHCTVYAQDDRVLAKIGDTKITMSDFNRIIGYYDVEKQNILEQSPQYKAVLLQRIVQAKVISEMARQKGFDKEAHIQEQANLLINDLLTAEYVKREVISKIKVTDDDIQLYYKAHQEEFKTPEMVRARHILVKVGKSASEEDKKKAKEKAEELLKKIRAGEDIAKLASEFSDDPGSKTKGGDLGFFPRGRMVPDFEKVAFSLKPGEVSDVFETTFGFHVLKVEEKKESVLEPYDKVKDKVKEKLLADTRKAKIEEFVEKAMKDASIELNFEPLFPKN